jgi:hypothetical protein
MSSIVDAIRDRIEKLPFDLGNKVLFGNMNIDRAERIAKAREKVKKCVLTFPPKEVKRFAFVKTKSVMNEKHLFAVNIKYYEDNLSEEMTSASFTVRSNHAANALKQKDVASLLADNDLVCMVSVNMVNSGIFGKEPEKVQDEEY